MNVRGIFNFSQHGFLINKCCVRWFTVIYALCISLYQPELFNNYYNLCLPCIFTPYKIIKSLIAIYTLISLLTGFSKINDILIYHRLIWNILHNIIVSQQFDFRKGLSKENATCKLIETVPYGWNCKKCIAGVFCDLTKAFDCVNQGLLKKIRILWCEGFTYRLVFYPEERQQQVDLIFPKCNNSSN